MVKSKFVTLDGLRGIAALTVMAYHYRDTPEIMGGLRPFENGWTAVDLFFVLSGFVLAHAYEGRFAAGMSTGRFMLLHLIRLYPLYIAAFLLIAPLQLFLVWKGYYAHANLQQTVLDIALGMLFLPKLVGSFFYPLNFPAWSLFLEVIANFFYRLGFRYLNWIALIVVIALSFIGIMTFQGDGHLGINSIWPFLSRVGFSFFAGVLAYRIWLIFHPRLRWSPWILVAAMLALLNFANSLEAFLVFPILVYLGACVEPAGATQAIFEELGVMSYGVYMLQIPVLTFVTVLWPKFSPVPLHSLAPWISLPIMGLVMVMAALLDRIYDRPVRKWLVSLTKKRVSPSIGDLATQTSQA